MSARPVPPVSAVDRSRPPSGGPVRPFQFPSFLRTTLANGLTVFAARQAEVPLVSLEVVVPSAGGLYEPQGQPGLTTLTAGLLDEGTARHSSQEIAEQMEQMGGYLASSADWDVAYVATGVLSQHWRSALEITAEVLSEPTFPTEEVERVRRQRLTEILRRQQDPNALVDDRLSQELYRGTVYAQPLVGTAESVASFQRETFEGFYRRHYSLRGSTLLAVGDLDPEELLREAEKLFANGPVEDPPEPPQLRVEPLSGIQVHLVDRPNATQTELRLGHVGVARTHPDWRTLTILNTLLGGKFTSRINLNLRERHGYTYGASSRFSPRRQPGLFSVSTSVQTPSAGAAAREVLSELRQIREEAVGAQELEETLSYIAGVFPYTVQTIGDLLKRLETLAIYDLPDDYFDAYLRSLPSFTPEQLLDAARRHIAPDRIAIVAAGPAETLEPQLADLGPVTVWPADAAAQPAGV
ncbi:MAG TPA: pitrilysin family protein [Thermoanaerobaculia bacterium]|nr:pitrilysin family protein [Thermoanaerobaculia bacterium]